MQQSTFLSFIMVSTCEEKRLLLSPDFADICSLSSVLFDGDNEVYPTNLSRVSNSDNDDNNL